MASKNQTKIIAEPGKQELFIVREFEAPRELVFHAFTDKDILVQWIGPREMSIRYEKFEPKEGGSYRYYSNVIRWNGICVSWRLP